MTDALHTHLALAQHRYALPGGAREVIFVRHGATTGETATTLKFGEMTLNDPPLREEGQAQAEAVAGRLRHATLAAIFITPLCRTRQTAAPLVALTGLQPVVIPELREVHMGDWEQDFQARAAAGDPLVRRMLAEENWEVIPGAERRVDFTARIRAGVGRIIAATAPGSTSVAVIHGGTLGEICRAATGSRPFAFFGPENGSLTRIILHADGHWSLRSYNDVAHLSG